MVAKIVEFKPSKLKQKEKDKLIVSYMDIVKIIAKKIYMKLPASYELDDLISVGTIGLMDAIDKYDPKQGVKFKTYAEYRIRGQILDELRSLDWASRATRDKIKNVERVNENLKSELGRDVTDLELCKALKLKQKDYFRLLQRIQPVQTFSLTPSELGESSLPGLEIALADNRNNCDPYESAEVNNMKEVLKMRIEDLPETEGKVLSLYYFEEKTMKEISEVLNVTESRVSQLHQTSIIRLKKRVKSIDLEAA
ncbi:MAG: FliA/WhiG family RNA polymerase sigma factor [Bacteriovoracaceae bacterium]|nr:FliA/WhiG family RNA polymerase sigma factor [Bacteriovoracaceae bacterium]